MDDISGWRKRIDEIDEKLLELLNKRARCAIEIGKIKSTKNMEICDPEREKQIISQLIETNNGPLSDDTIRKFFELLFKESRQIEKIEY